MHHYCGMWLMLRSISICMLLMIACNVSTPSTSSPYHHHYHHHRHHHRYFKLGKLSSFQRQLNLYGFNRITRGLDATGYYHEYFLRDREYLAKRILRKRIKGTKIKGATNPDLEPDFYAMPAVQKHPDPTLAPATVTRGTTTNSSSSTHSSDDGDSSTASAAVVSSSEAEIAAVANAMAHHHNPQQQQQPPLCNFVFPQFFLPSSSSSSEDPIIDDALWPTTMPLSSSSPPKEDYHHHHDAPWDDQPLSDSILLGQYLVFGEDNVEAV